MHLDWTIWLNRPISFIEEKVNPKKFELYEKLDYEITWVLENKWNGDGSLINVILDKWKNHIQIL
jgi:hypothetical protein